MVQEGASRKTLKPKSLLPLKIDQRGAWERFRAWIKSLWFAPGDLKRYAPRLHAGFRRCTCENGSLSDLQHALRVSNPKSWISFATTPVHPI